MNKPIKTIAVALAAIASMSVQQTEACTRATYIGPDNTVITGRTMDWKEDLMSNIYVFPRGMQRAGYNKGNAVNWTSKYGSVIAAGYDIGTCDGMNEKGLVASLLFLPESVYHRPGQAIEIIGKQKNLFSLLSVICIFPIFSIFALFCPFSVIQYTFSTL